MLKTKQKIRLARLVQLVVMGVRRFLGLGPVTRVSRNGLAWELDLREGIDFSIWLLGSFEPETVHCYQQIIQPGDVVLDIGANIGAHTPHLARQAGARGRVIAFEPTDYAFAKLTRNVALNPELAGRIQCLQVMLVAAETGDAPTAPLYSSWPLKDEAGTHHLHQGRLMATSDAKARTLDSALAGLGLDRLDCIKLDIDGAECAMLRGARSVLTRWHPTIIMELAPYVLAEHGTSLADLIHLLRDYGYALYDASTGQALAMDAAVLEKMIPPGASLNVVAQAPGAQVNQKPPAVPAPVAQASRATTAALAAACLLILATYALMIDLRGVSNDEGFRLGIMNGGQPFSPGEPGTAAGWPEVMKAITPYAYQPLYFLLQNTVMRVADSHAEVLLRSVNIFFLWVSLQGLVALSRGWRLLPRLFLLGHFSFNAYLFMHVLQIREYTVCLAFYIWSTWLVLRLDEREFGRQGADLAWFAAYGVLLALGFYTQTWVVLPAIAQGLFLVVRRRRSWLSFSAHLALSYAIVLAATLPYLRGNPQKVNIGRWGDPADPFWAKLSNGFHAVLSGYQADHGSFPDFLFWFWIVVLAGATALLCHRRFNAGTGVPLGEFRRQGRLMILSLAALLAFQVVYFFKVDTLSLWPRYFAAHYFFVLWLLALAFKYLHDLGSTPALAPAPRRGLQVFAGAILAVAVTSGIYQTRSYYRNPYVDSGLSAICNWRTVSAALAREIEPGDLVLTHDFLHMWTLTYTRNLSNPVVPLPKLEGGVNRSIRRVVYLEPTGAESSRDALTTRLATLGFAAEPPRGLPTADGSAMIPLWQLVIFPRR